MNKTSMHIPKKYFHDRTILALMVLNSLLALVAVLYVLLRVDPAEGTLRIVRYRSNLGIDAFKSGSVKELQLLAVFAALQYVCSWFLSMRLYVHRRNLAVVILALTSFMLLLTIVVTDALLKVN